MAVQILLSLAILIISAKIFGEIAERLKMASLAGEIFGGIIAGPILHLVAPDATLQEIAGLGILFVFFLIGLNLRSEKSELYSSSILAIVSSLASFAAGFILAFYSSGDIFLSSVVGAALLSTSPSATMNAIAVLGEYKTRAYKFVISAELVESFLAIIVISGLSLLFSGKADTFTILLLVSAFVAFLAAAVTIGPVVTKKLLSLLRFAKDEQIYISIPLIILFIAAFISEKTGLLGLAGAFLIGIMMRNFQITESTIVPKIKTIGHGFFIPLFFAYSALSMDIGSVSLWLIVIMIIAAVVGKIAVYGLLGNFFNLKNREKKIIILAMLPKGEFTIIIAQIALAAAIISTGVYSSLIIFTIVSVALSPFLLRFFGK